MTPTNHYLVIRFSAIGDIVQALSIPSVIKRHDQNAKIDFLTRKEFANLCENHPNIDQVICFDRSAGLSGLFRLSKTLGANRYTHIYDIHNNLRSNLICLLLNGILNWKKILSGRRFLRRPNQRVKKFLLLNLKINLFAKPFAQQRSLLAPLKNWSMSTALPETPQYFPTDQETVWSHQQIDTKTITLAPSASYALKKWPKQKWLDLIEKNADHQFAILGGPEDADEFSGITAKNITNLVGKLSLRQSAAIIAQSRMLITNDTGMLHLAEQLGKPCIALMGPAPFGYPSRLDKTVIVEKHLKCRPCSRHGQGPCTNSIYHECMTSIGVDEVQLQCQKIIDADL